MGHRAKHRNAPKIPGAGPATTKATTGRAQAQKRAAKAHPVLPVVAFLRMVRR